MNPNLTTFEIALTIVSFAVFVIGCAQLMLYLTTKHS
jgi:hypothetical protein